MPQKAFTNSVEEIMQKLFITLVLVASVFAGASNAFAYELSGPITTLEPNVGLGVGEADLSKPSIISGTFSVDRTDYNQKVWITTGDVAGAKDGYGFYTFENKLYGVTSSNGFMWVLGLGFIKPNVPVTVRAVYTPGESIRFDTSAVGNYSRGIEQQFLPNTWIRTVDALDTRVMSSFNVATLTVSNWSYKQ